jgi:S1-C subfamily serine protease
MSQGTAFFVRPDGVLLTALHVVDGARAVAVACLGREPAPATLGGGVRGRDLVALKTSLAAPAYLSLGDTRSLLPGDSVLTVGFAAVPNTDTTPRFSDGSLTAVSGPDTETAFLQMTIPVQPGGSGGPVVAADGSVVGVVSSGAAIILLLREPGIFPQNVSWAIKADFARPLFEQPPALPATKTRSEAIDRATRSACRVLVTR